MGCAVGMVLVIPLWVCAEQIEMQNGDRYVGKVLSLNADTVVLQNEVLGTVRLPRSKVAQITLGANAGTNLARQASPANGPVGAAAVSRTNAGPDLPAGLRQIGAHTNLIRQVQGKFLGDAGPEANQKFDELLSGLMSGKITVDDVRAQAKMAADQLRALKRDSGEDAGFAADTYLAILDHFLNETAPAAGSVTNTPAPPAASKAGRATEQE
jgi:hypothetical protein